MSQIPLATPLAGIKVLEFSHTVMGPTAGLVFAELGADVIKVEPAPKGDHTRGLGGFGRDAADPDHFYLIGKWADIEEHRRIREFVAREIKPEFVQLIGCRPDRQPTDLARPGDRRDRAGPWWRLHGRSRLRCERAALGWQFGRLPNPDCYRFPEDPRDFIAASTIADQPAGRQRRWRGRYHPGWRADGQCGGRGAVLNLRRAQ